MKIKKNIFPIFLSIILAFVLLDTALYFSHYHYLLGKSTPPQYYFQANKELGYSIVPNFPTTTHVFSNGKYTVWSNSLGCFDEEYRGEEPYIYLTGGSWVWGFAPFEDKWGTIMEKELGIRVVQCGVFGYSTHAELLKTTQDLEYLPSPKLIVVGATAYSDIDTDTNFPQYTVYDGYVTKRLKNEEEYKNFANYCSADVPAHTGIARIRCFLTTHSVLFNLFKSKIRKMVETAFPQLTQSLEQQGVLSHQQGDALPRDYEKHFENILGFKQLAKDKGSKLLFVLINGTDERVTEFLDKEGIDYIGLDYLRGPKFQYKTDGHWNIDGNHSAGSFVSEFILENHLIKE